DHLARAQEEIRLVRKRQERQRSVSRALGTARGPEAHTIIRMTMEMPAAKTIAPSGRSSASLLRPVNHHDVRVLLYPFEDDHGTVGGDVEVADDDVATEIG